MEGEPVRTQEKDSIIHPTIKSPFEWLAQMERLDRLIRFIQYDIG